MNTTVELQRQLVIEAALWTRYYNKHATCECCEQFGSIMVEHNTSKNKMF